MKSELAADIISKLNRAGILAVPGKTADITIDQEFLNAGWLSGKKKIAYEASVYLAEEEKTVYFWELTKETGSGFSFGGGGEENFQFGKTVYRKMKSVQYGPDGKAFEIDLDLGTIPKSIQESAGKYGWRFKQVLRREKASFPV
jgi:hypothetical protein